MIIAFVFILAGIIFIIGTLIYTKRKNNLQEVKPIDKSNIKKSKKTLSNLWGIDGFNNQVKINWNKNFELLSCWKEGKTGIPWVDANMRELLITGY